MTWPGSSTMQHRLRSSKVPMGFTPSIRHQEGIPRTMVPGQATSNSPGVRLQISGCVLLLCVAHENFNSQFFCNAYFTFVEHA